MAPGVAYIQPIERGAWSELSPLFLDHNYRQAWAFAVAGAERVGAASEHVAIHRGTELVSIANVRVKRLPAGFGGIAYVNGGPLVRRETGSDLDHFDFALAALREEFAVRRRLVLRVVAPVGPDHWNASLVGLFRRQGFFPVNHIGGYRTLLLDLGPGAEELRRGFAQKWRNCLNSAERKGLAVEVGNEPELLDRFSRLFGDFVARKGFAVDLDADFYARVQRNHSEGERYTSSLAYHGGNLVAGHVAALQGDTSVYLLGATDPEGLRLKAAYLLQWHAILEAQQRGLRWYDLGGIDPDANPGVYHFKKGLGGAGVRAAGPFQFNPSGLRGSAVALGEGLYRGSRALRARLARSRSQKRHG